ESQAEGGAVSGDAEGDAGMRQLPPLRAARRLQARRGKDQPQGLVPALRAQAEDDDRDAEEVTVLDHGGMGRHGLDLLRAFAPGIGLRRLIGPARRPIPRDNSARSGSNLQRWGSSTSSR